VPALRRQLGLVAARQHGFGGHRVRRERRTPVSNDENFASWYARKRLIDDLVAAGADREHFESLTPDQFARFCETTLQIASGELRRVTLSDGRGVLVDGDCTHTDEEIRAAVEN
jgi:hypothetical protein